MVAIPAVASHAPHTDFDVGNFKYNVKKDQYTCPARRVLRSNGNWYKKSRGKSETRVKQYKTPACKGCLLRALCTTNPAGRIIERSENAHLIEQNKERILSNPELYKQRQAIVEHPFGTMKRQWGFDHVLTKKGLERAAGDIGLMFVAYNLRRLLKLLPKDAFGMDVRIIGSKILALFQGIRPSVGVFLAFPQAKSTHSDFYYNFVRTPVRRHKTFLVIGL
jgi:hypothetical protein